MDRALLDLYSDFLLSATGERTATKLSSALDGFVSHDKITRFLSEAEYGSKELWHEVKPYVRKIEQSRGGVLIFDDTIEAKPHTDENEIVAWHFDHCAGRNVKGINILSCLVSYEKLGIPVAFEIVKKNQTVIDPKTNKAKRVASITKNEQMQDMLQVCIQNDVKFDYVLADTWYSSNETMEFIHKRNKKFIFPTKDNRLVSLTNRAKKFVHVYDIELEPNATQLVYLKGCSVPVLLTKKIFINKDGSSGILYLICNDTELDGAQIYEIYKKRWKIEEYHKSLKSNLGLAQSPTKIQRTQNNHVFATIYAYCKLEILCVKQAMNHFALKSKLLVAATRTTFDTLQNINRSLCCA